MSGTSFESSEKLDILIKEQFQVTNTNENTPWYLETNVNYNTYTNGKDILIDEFDVVSTISQNCFKTNILQYLFSIWPDLSKRFCDRF